MSQDPQHDMEITPSAVSSATPAPSQPTFDDLFPATAREPQVRYTSSAHHVITLPSEGTASSEFYNFAMSVTKCVNDGYSLAVAAGDSVDISKIVDYEQAARAMMETREMKMYDSWKGGLALDNWNFATNALALTSGSAAHRRFQNHALDLCTMYKCQGVTPEQAKAWTEKHQGWVPLLIAISKVRKARAHACGGEEGADPCQLTEKRMARRINGILGSRRAALGARVKRINRAITEAEHGCH